MFAFRTGITLCAGAVALALSMQTAAAQVGGTGSPVTPSACDVGVTGASTLNAFDLFAASEACSAETRQEDSIVLLLLAKSRAGADYRVLPPPPVPGEDPTRDLATIVASEIENTGFDELYRSPAAVASIGNRIHDAKLTLENNYNPGWTPGRTLGPRETALYAALARFEQDLKFWNLRNYARLIQDDIYYNALQDSLAYREACMQGNTEQLKGPNYFQLRAVMRRRRAELGTLPQPVSRFPIESRHPTDTLTETSPPIVSGVNGPEYGGQFVFGSADEVRQSWLTTALGQRGVEDLLSKVDFSTDSAS